tara:strand:- start:268 stop:564 length:297 start_codon:yes stop_codon:yes gene_type:complete
MVAAMTAAVAVVPSIGFVLVEAPVDPAGTSPWVAVSVAVILDPPEPWVPFLGGGGTTGAAGGPVTASASTHLPVLVAPSQILIDVSSFGFPPTKVVVP